MTSFEEESRTERRLVIAILGSQRWDSIWRSGPQLASRLAAHHDVLFIEPHHDVHESRLSSLRSTTTSARPAASGVIVASGPRGLPLLRQHLPAMVLRAYAPLAMRINARLLRRHLSRVLDQLGWEADVLWIHGIHDPRVASDHAGPSLFYVYDEFAEFVHNSRIRDHLARVDRALVEQSSVVVASSHSQWSRRAPHGDARFVPNGVDIDTFNLDVEPHETTAGERPVIGYAGWVGYQMDVRLLSRVAQTFPEARVMIVGPSGQLPDSPDLHRLRAQPNVEWIGPQSRTDLARYMRGFTVGLIPYLLEGYVLSAYPLKVNEYLACGTPVVATALPELAQFDAPVDVADDHESFVAAVRAALNAPSHGETERFQAASRNSWDHRVDVISSILHEVVEQP